MAVEVIDKIKPKNGGSFPVVEAVDVEVGEGLRLPEALENKANLSTVNYALNNKADKTTTTGLQNQINEIITPVTQDAEVQNARVGANTTVYTTLKERLDTEYNIHDEKFTTYTDLLNGEVDSEIVYDEFHTTSTFTNINRIYIFKEIVIDYGIKELILHTNENDNCRILILQKNNDDTYTVLKEYTAVASDNTARFKDIYVPKKNCYLAIKGDIGYRQDLTNQLKFDTTFYSSIVNNIVSDYTSGESGPFISLTLYKKSVYTVDDFEGSDSDKLQQAIDACSAEGGIIKITRDLILDKDIFISHIYSQNHRINIIGDTNHNKINVATYSFKGTAGNTGGVVFRNLELQGNYDSGVLLRLGNQASETNQTLCGIVFDNCVISNLAHIINSPHYIQSVTFDKCLIRRIKNIALSTRGYIFYNLVVIGCVIEGLPTFAEINYGEGCNIKNNVIEGCSDTPIVIKQAARAVNIEGNYFEANATGTEHPGRSILITLPEGRERNIRIVGNYFYENNGNAIVIPANSGTGHGDIVIESNTILGANSHLVGGTDEITYTDVLCAFNHGRITELNSNKFKVITANDIFTLLNTES